MVQPPEDWLFKVFTDDSMVDILFRLSGSAVDRDMLERADELEVLSVSMPVLSATDVVVAKLPRDGRAPVRPGAAPGRRALPA